MNVTLPAQLQTSDGNRLSWAAYALLALLCVAMYLPGINALPVVDRDEALFAQSTKQMIETGNYVDIHFQTETRYKKPIGIYWLQALSVKLLNPAQLNAIWAYRVPSFLGAMLAVLMTAATGALLFGPASGLAAAMLLSCCMVLNVEARLAKTDAALLSMIMISQYALARAYMAAQTGERKVGWPIALAFWTAQSAAFLIKGPILLLVTGATLLGLKLSKQKLGWFRQLHPVAGTIYALALTAPWFIAIITASHGQFAQESGGHDFFAKLWQGQNRGILPPGLHALIFPAVFFPSSLFALLAIPDVWRRRTEPAVRFCLCWIVPTWIMFELALTKLPHYVLPTYPAIAMLAAFIGLQGFPAIQPKRRWTLAITILWFVVGIKLATGMIVLPYFMDHDWQMAGFVAGFLLLSAMGATLTLLPQNRLGAVAMLALGMVMFLSITFSLILPAINNFWPTRAAVEMADASKPCPAMELMSASYDEPSLVFAMGTKMPFVNNSTQLVAAMRDDSCLLGLVDGDHKPAFIDGFTPYEAQPVVTGTFSGLNIGSGRRVDLTLYRLATPVDHDSR